MPTPDEERVAEAAVGALRTAVLLGRSLSDVTPRIERIPGDLLHESAVQAAADDRDARYEESGHAVAARKSGVPVLAVHVGRDRARGERGHVLLPGLTRPTSATMQTRIVIALAGVAARSLFGCDSYTSRGDVAEATRLALLLGFDDRERLTFIDHCSARAQRLVRENVQWIEAVAEALKDRPDLTGDDVDALRPEPLLSEDPPT